MINIDLGTGRRDSATQITSISPPNEPQEPATNQRRRRSSLAQLTDILREWSGGGGGKSERGNKLYRRETLGDIAKSFPWSRQTTTDASHLERLRKRRESSVDSGIRSQSSTKSRKDSTITELKNDFARLWGKKETPQPQPPPTVISPTYRGWLMEMLLLNYFDSDGIIIFHEYFRRFWNTIVDTIFNITSLMIF